MFLHTDNEVSDQTARMRRLLSHRWAYMSEGTFSQSVVHMIIESKCYQRFIR